MRRDLREWEHNQMKVGGNVSEGRRHLKHVSLSLSLLWKSELLVVNSYAFGS